MLEQNDVAISENLHCLCLPVSKSLLAIAPLMTSSDQFRWFHQNGWAASCCLDVTRAVHISANSESYSSWKAQPDSPSAFLILQETISKSICKNSSLSQDGEIEAEIFKVYHAAEAQDYLE